MEVVKLLSWTNGTVNTQSATVLSFPRPQSQQISQQLKMTSFSPKRVTRQKSCCEIGVTPMTRANLIFENNVDKNDALQKLQHQQKSCCAKEVLEKVLNYRMGRENVNVETGNY